MRTTLLPLVRRGQCLIFACVLLFGLQLRLEAVGGSPPPPNPSGSFQSLSPQNIVQNQTIAGSGWASPGIIGDTVAVYIFLDPASSSNPNMDLQSGGWICQATYDGYNWSFSYNIGSLALGAHTLVAVAGEGSVNTQENLGSQAFTVEDGTPSTTISASVSGVDVGTSFTITATTTGNHSNITNQAIDYSADGGNTWVSGTVGAGTAWQGYAPNNTLTSTFSFNTPQTIIFRAWGQSEFGQQSAYVTTSVAIDTSPTATLTSPATTIALGQTVALSTAAVANGNLVVSQEIDYLAPGSSTWVKGANWSGGPTGSNTLAWTVPVSILNAPGTWQFRGWASDALNAVSNYATASITVNQAVPVAPQWSNQTFAGTQRVTAAELDAVFVDPYTSSVVQPTGWPSYSYSSGGSFNSLAVGTLLPPGTYTIEASYPGDVNYTAATATATWTVNTQPPPTVPSTVLLQGTYPAGDVQTLQATSSVSSSTTNPAIIDNGADIAVQVLDGGSIVLLPGFKAEPGCTFQAEFVGSVYPPGEPIGPPPSDPLAADSNDDGWANIAQYNLGYPLNQYLPPASTLGNSLPTEWAALSQGDPSVSNAVGRTEGSLTVDNSGTAIYTIPIYVCPGTGGMEPKVSLTYNSQAGAGIAGYGWSLNGLSTITRGGQSAAVEGNGSAIDGNGNANYVHGMNFSSTDRYYLDGQRLIAINGPDGGNGTEYRMQQDSFSRIVSYGSDPNNPSYFVVWTKAGQIVEYGHTSDSALMPVGALTPTGAPAAIGWAVDKISDTAGNYMTFAYSTNNSTGEQYISEIDYTGNTTAGTSPYDSLKFSYATRQDPSSAYTHGALTSSTQILTGIEACTGVGSGANTIRAYTMAYENRPYTNRTILDSVTETGADGKAYPPLTFTYNNPPTGWDQSQSSTWAPPAALGTGGSTQTPGDGFVDLLGNGRQDFINYAYGGTSSAWINDPANGWVPADGNHGYPNYILPLPVSGYANPNGGELNSGESLDAKFVDLNGDGLPDLSNGTTTYLNTPGQGWVEHPEWALPTPPDVDNTYVRGDCQFIDLNGDGLQDCVVFESYTTSEFIDSNGGTDTNTNTFDEVWINLGPNGVGTTNGVANGTHWLYAPQWLTWLLDPELFESFFMDVNGDGLPDQVERITSINDSASGLVILNTGQGWSAPSLTSPYIPPVDVFSDRSDAGMTIYPMGTDLTDLNSSGLSDIVKNAAGVNGAWFNTGIGWAQAPSSYNSPVATGTGQYGTTSNGVAFLDIDNDDMPAVVYNYNGTSGVWRNTGSGWSAQTDGSDNVPWELASTNIQSTGGQFVDLEGNGALDEVWNWQQGTSALASASGAALNKRINPDRLIQVATGMGVSTYITYKPLTDPTVYTKDTTAVYPDQDLILPQYVVSTVQSDDGAGGEYQMDYTYAGLRSNAIYGSEGFASTTVSDSRTGIVTTTQFDQTYPFYGMVASTTIEQPNGAVLSQTTTNWEDLYRNVTSTPPPGNNFNLHFPYADLVVQQSYDLNGAYVSGTWTTTTYDDYGNPLHVDVQPIDANQVPLAGYDRSTVNTYNNVITANSWFIGQIATAQTTASAPGVNPITHTSNFAYDPTTGLVQQEISEPGNPLQLTTTYGYDAFGNVTQAITSGAGLTDASGHAASRTISTQYDALGQFRVSTTNALNQAEYYTYDPRWGVIISQKGPNGLTTAWAYDGMGRQIQENRPDGTTTNTDYRWANSSMISGAASAAYLIETDMVGSAGTPNAGVAYAPPAIAIYDNMGRKLYSFSVNGGGYDGNLKIVGIQTQYDNMGRAWWVSLPFYYGDTPQVGTEVQGYDLLNRPLMVLTADEETSGGFDATTFAYNGLWTNTTNCVGQVTQTTRNLQGQIVSVVNNAGAAAGAPDRGETDYTYDADGNVLTTSVLNNNGASFTTSYTYDLFGHKIAMNDPDRGAWSYAYDAEGELVSQTDAKNQTSTMTYDQLGRLVVRTEKEGTTTWTYDSAANGIGELASVSAPNNYSESYIYDNLGRPSVTSHTINTGSTTEAFTLGQQYDSFGRPTITTYPGGYQVENVYNQYGFLKDICQASASGGLSGDTFQGQLFWQADSYSLWGGVNGCTYGNGITEDTVIANTTGRSLGFGIGLGSNSAVAFYGYGHNALGNLIDRDDAATGRYETYQYDGLNRLTQAALSVPAGGLGTSATVTVSYDSLGNILNKSDVGAYAYGQNGAGPHAVTAAGGNSYSYDVDGNMTAGAGRSIAWTSFNQAQTITSGSHFSTFTFDADHQRATQVTDLGTTVYVGSAFELFTDKSGNQTEKFYIFTPAGRSVVRTVSLGAGTVSTRYLHQDALGSIVAATDELGVVQERYAYDPWGKQTQLLAPSSGNAATTRGFTDQEMLEDLGLIHMNGRIYDPVLGRFLSADPMVQNAADSQTYNAYSYCGNNPLNTLDPSGYGFFSFLSNIGHFFTSLFDDSTHAIYEAINALAGIGNRLYHWAEENRQALEFAAIIVASIYLGGLAAAEFGTVEPEEVTLGAIQCDGFPTIAITATVDAGTTGVTSALLGAGLSAGVINAMSAAVGAAAGGFVSGVGLEAVHGGTIGQDLEAGVKGAEYGLITGGIAGGMNVLNGYLPGGLSGLKIAGLPTGWSQAGDDLAIIAGKGVEGAVTSELENKNASAGFWSGAVGAAGGFFSNPEVAKDGKTWNPDWAIFDDLGKGVAGGLGNMNKKGQGFGSGFWSAVANGVGSQLGTYELELINGSGNKGNPWLNPIYQAPITALAGGFSSRAGGKMFNAGFYNGAEADGIDSLVAPFASLDTSVSGDVSKANALLQTKTVKKKGKTTTTMPLDSISGGTWANGSAWDQLH